MAETKKTIEGSKESDEKQRIIDYITECHKEARDASISRRKAWKELWDVYQNKQDYRMKEDWQTKMFAPKVWMKIERAAAEVKRALLSINKLFKLDIDDSRQWSDEEKSYLQDQMPAIETKFKRALEKSNLANVYSEMSKGGFLLGVGVPKVLWDYEQNGLNFQNVPALQTFVCPDYKVYEDERPKYLIEEVEMDLASFKVMAAKVNEAAGQKIYDTDEIDRLDEDFKDVEKKQAERKQLGFGEFKAVNKRVLLWQFWGDIVSKDEKEIDENNLCVLVNKKYLVRRQKNPFAHQKVPHVLTFPLPYPHRGIAGCSLVEPMVKILYTYNNLMNMYVDNMNWSVNKMFEYDPNRLLNPKEIFTVYPGKLLKVNEGAEPVLKETPVTAVGKDAIPGMEFLDREMQEATSVTEFLMSMPSRKAKTLGEVEIKTAESKGLFDTIARDLEQNSIKPLLEMSYSLLVQFAGFEPIEGKYVIKVGGLSLLLIQKEQIEQVEKVINIAVKVPDIAHMTNMGELWKKFLGVLNLTDVYIEEEDRGPSQQMIQNRAMLDAQRQVANMSPEEIMRSNIKKAG